MAVVDAHVNVTYLMPVAAISYVDMKLQASLDTTNKNPFIIDTEIVFDKVLLEVAKRFNETISFSDAITKIDTAKNITDNASVTDTLTTLLIFIRKFSDTANISEQKSISFLRSVVDSFSLQDKATRSTLKNISDGVAMQDGADIHDGLITVITKYIMNMAFVSDANNKDIGKVLKDTQSTSDTITKQLSRPLFDSFNATDTHIFAFSTIKFDSIALLEQISLANSKLISGDFVAFSDQIVKNIGSKLNDSATPDDAGWLYAQGYCDITYFLEDYVGEYRTFT